MSAAWLVYALVTGAFIAVACVAVEALCRQRRVPARWVWAVGLLAIMLVSVRAITARPEEGTVGAALSLPRTSSSSATNTLAPDLLRSLSAAGATARALLGELLVAATRRVPAAVGEGAIVAWIVASMLALLVIAGVHVRIARVRRGWPAAELHGLDVRISSTIGPAVLGVFRAFIVVPRWLLARSADEQRLVLAHESEHVRGRDHLLLSVAYVTAALVPWHPAAWIMLARLRLAIELDCDARVLRRGVAPKVYGALLIDLASQCSGFTVGATALADEASHLQRRLLAMKPIASRHLRLRTGALVAAGCLAVLVACEAKLPTSADVANMDVASAEKSAAQANLVEGFGSANTTYFIDGTQADAASAHALPKNRIASIQVTRINGTSEMRIATFPNGAVAPEHTRIPVNVTTTISHGDSLASMQPLSVTVGPGEHARTFTGLIYIDGVRSDNATLQALDPRTIVSMQVIKGARAAEESGDPAAVNGIIRVTTRRATPK